LGTSDLTEEKRLLEEANFLAFEDMIREGLRKRQQERANGDENEVNQFTGEGIVPATDSPLVTEHRQARLSKILDGDTHSALPPPPPSNLLPPSPPPLDVTTSGHKVDASIFGDEDVVSGPVDRSATVPPPPPAVWASHLTSDSSRDVTAERFEAEVEEEQRIEAEWTAKVEEDEDENEDGPHIDADDVQEAYGMEVACIRTETR
jgi:hypothetical protein